VTHRYRGSCGRCCRTGRRGTVAGSCLVLAEVRPRGQATEVGLQALLACLEPTVPPRTCLRLDQPRQVLASDAAQRPFCDSAIDRWHQMERRPIEGHRYRYLPAGLSGHRRISPSWSSYRPNNWRDTTEVGCRAVGSVTDRRPLAPATLLARRLPHPPRARAGSRASSGPDRTRS
jgi:hypothetical protein